MIRMSTPRRLPATVIDLVVAYCRRLGDIVTLLEASFAHQLDEQRLAEALLLLQESQPVLGSRLVISPWQAHWEQLAPEQRSRLVVVHDTSAYEAFRISKLEAERGAPVQACLFRHHDGDRLLFKLAHEAGDGGAIKESVGLLAEIYNRLAHEPRYRPVPNWSGSRGLEQVLRRIPLRAYPGIFGNIKYFQDTLRLARQDALRSAATKTSAAVTEREQLLYPQRLIDKERTAALGRYGKPYGATITDLFLAATFRAVAQALSTGQDLQLTITVDLRRYLPGGRAEGIGNLSGTEIINLLSVGESYANTLAEIVRTTSELKRNYIGINGFSAFVPLVRPLPPRLLQTTMDVFTRRMVPRSNVPSLFSNIGIIPTPVVTFDTPASQARLLPSATYPPAFVPAMSGYQGELTLSIGTYGRPGVPTAGEQFLDRTLAELPV